MYYFIVNPASGSGRGRFVWQTVKKELDRSHIQYKAFLLSKRGEARELAASLSQSKQPLTLVVVGGDGTINETVDGLFTDAAMKNKSTAHITFGCIPTGSGNDFVRGLGLAKAPLDALHAILNPKEIRPINIGCTHYGTDMEHARSFAVSSGIGFDAAVCDLVLDSKLKTALNRFHSGKLVYLFTALWLIFSMKRLTTHVTTDCGVPQTFEKTYFVAAMNLRYEGGGFQFCPDAKEDDGLLDLLIVNNIPRLLTLTILPLAFSGRHVGKKGIRIVRCKEASVSTDAPLCVHTDGEIPAYSKQVSFSLHDKKLAVIIR